jgi:hypothetical protein
LATILAEEHGDDLGHRVMCAYEISSRIGISRSDNNELTADPLPIFITKMTRERGKQGKIAQIW